MFQETKTAQMAAYLLLKSGRAMPHMKLVKLLYLAEKRSLLKNGGQMSYDNLVSLPKGPVLSTTLNIINGKIAPQPDGWAHYIGAKKNHAVSLKAGIEAAQLRKLSRADRGVLDTIWRAFGRMNQFQISDYTHDHCPEWQDPGKSSLPISIERLFVSNGYSAAVAKYMDQTVAEHDYIDRTFEKHRLLVSGAAKTADDAIAQAAAKP